MIECMASSDNVIRAGFTPKFKDVSTLTSILTYNYAPPDQQKLEAVPYPYATLNVAAYKSGSTCDLYDPPIEEFSVIRTVLGDKAKATFEGLRGPSIVICTQGRGTISVDSKKEDMKEGFVYFVGATAVAVLEGCGGDDADDGDDGEFVTFRAFCELAPGAKI